ncbi:hypothetical protein [Methanoculleus formosensis]|uniref:hypothetical protein n=1 Tax=Methanoculleus formosensis TaxID=2590886 RepID=UPI0021BE5C9E|nr:hypothetical protein [Methanoculleus sp. Afa-1]
MLIGVPVQHPANVLRRSSPGGYRYVYLNLQMLPIEFREALGRRRIEQVLH